MQGSASFRVATELKILKTQKKKWTELESKVEEQKTNVLLQKLETLDKLEGENGLTQCDRERLHGLRVEIANML